MRARYVVMFGVMVGIVILWASLGWAGGWAPVDTYVRQGTFTFRGIVKLVLMGVCGAAIAYFLATRGFSMDGIGACAGAGVAAIFIIAVMFPIIDSIAEGATLDGATTQWGARPGSAIVDSHATLGQGSRATNDWESDGHDGDDDFDDELEMDPAGGCGASGDDCGDQEERARDPDVSPAFALAARAAVVIGE